MDPARCNETVYLIAGHPGEFSGKPRARLSPIKPVSFEIPYKLVKQSVVLSKMFKEGAFIEGITKTAVFPEFSNQVLSDIVSFLKGSLHHIAEANHAIDLFLAAEFLQMRRLQKISAKSIAKDFESFHSFGSLPDYLVLEILKELDPLQLCMAEARLKRDGRSADTSALWKKLQQKHYPEASCISDAKALVTQMYFEKTISLFSPPIKSRHSMTLASYRNLTDIEGADHLGPLRSTLNYMASHIQRFALKNTGLGENVVYSIISRLISASELRLENNQLNQKAGIAIARAIKQNPKRALVSLDISNNNISAMGMRSLATSNVRAPTRQTLPSLREESRHNQKLSVCLADNNIGDPFLIEIGGCIPSIQVLNVSNNKLGSQGGQALAIALHRMPCLTHLSMRSCSLDGLAVTAITEAILKTSIALVYFDVSDNIEACDRFYTGKLDQLIAFTPTLAHIKAGGNKFATKSLLSMAQALRSLSNLQTLDLQAIELESAIQTVALACQQSITLKTFNLANTCLSSKSMLNIASVLAYNTSLKTLNISGNELDGEASLALSLALQQNSTLATLILNAGLGTDPLGSTSLHNIINGIQHSTTIKKISFINQRMKNVDCISVIQLLPICPKLISIDLRGNRVCDRGLDTIVHFLIENRRSLSRPILLDLRLNDLTLASENMLRSFSNLLPNIRILDDGSQYVRI